MAGWKHLAIFLLIARYNSPMTNEEILEKQVEALEKLLQLRSAIIEELEQKVTNLRNELAVAKSIQWPGTTQTPWTSPSPWYGQGGGSVITINTNTCPDGTPHQYPSMWGGTNPPSCSKCGAQVCSGNGALGAINHGGSISTT